MRGLVKIGRTTGSVEKRAKDLSSTGVPFPFEVAFKMKVSDCVAAEKWLHKEFGHKRVNRGKEFFRIPAEDVVNALKEKVSPGAIAKEKEEKRLQLAKNAQLEEKRRRLEKERKEESERKEAEFQRKIDKMFSVIGFLFKAAIFIGFFFLVAMWRS